MADAIDALKTRRAHLMSVIATSDRERSRYQGAVDSFQDAINTSTAEVASIDLAIEVLEAAVEYANPNREEPTDD